MAPTPETRKRSISFRPTAWEEIMGRLDAGETSVSPTVSEVIERYATLLARERKVLQTIFTPNELAAIADVCNNTVFDPQSIAWVEMAAQDGLDPGIVKKRNIDKAQLLEKLAATSLGGKYALVEAVERFWRHSTTIEIEKILDY